MKLKILIVVAAATLGIASTVGFAATLTVGSWHLWGGSQALTKGTCTLSGSSSTTDTYVNQSLPTTSNASSTTMSVQPNAGTERWAFVTFNLSGCAPAIPTSGGADTATLKLVVTITPRNSRPLTVTPVLSTWSSTLTWNGAQSLSYGSPTTTFATGTTSSATLSIPVTIDVDALIKNPSSRFGWRISDEGTQTFQDTTTFATSQSTTSSFRPTLVINYER